MYKRRQKDENETLFPSCKCTWYRIQKRDTLRNDIFSDRKLYACKVGIFRMCVFRVHSFCVK